MNITPKNIIVGAGLTGLSAAAAMVSRGISPLIIEKDNVWGGLARSFQLGGQVFDAGVHIFRWPSDTGFRRFLEKNIPDLKSMNIRYVLNVKNRKISPQPELANFLKYPMGLKMSLPTKSFMPSGDLSLLSEKLKYDYGKWLYDNFFNSYLKKKIPVLNENNIHSDWWSNRNRRNEFNEFISTGEKYVQSNNNSLKSAAVKIRDFMFGYKNAACYHPDGIGEIANRIASYLNRRGVEITLNTEVININSNKSGSIAIKLSNGKVVLSRNLIWTGNIIDLADLLNIAWPGDLKFLDTIVVFVVVQRDQFTARKILFEYCASEDILFNRVYYNDYFSNGEGEFGICAEISCDENIKMLSDDELINSTIDGLGKIGSIDRKKDRIIDAKVIKIARSHPVYPLNYRRLLEKFQLSVKKYANIYLAGRGGSFNNLSMPRTMTAGWKIGAFCSKEVGSDG